MSASTFAPTAKPLNILLTFYIFLIQYCRIKLILNPPHTHKHCGKRYLHFTQPVWISKNDFLIIELRKYMDINLLCNAINKMSWIGRWFIYVKCFFLACFFPFDFSNPILVVYFCSYRAFYMPSITITVDLSFMIYIRVCTCVHVFVCISSYR